MPVKFICGHCGAESEGSYFDPYEGWHTDDQTHTYTDEEGKSRHDIFCTTYDPETETYSSCWGAFKKENNIVLIPKVDKPYRGAHWRVVNE